MKSNKLSRENKLALTHSGLLVDHKIVARKLGVDVDQRNAAVATLIFSDSTTHTFGPYVSGNPYVESIDRRLYPQHGQLDGEENVDCAERKIVADGKKIVPRLRDLTKKLTLTIALTSENTPCVKCEKRVEELVQQFMSVCSALHLYIFSEAEYHPKKGMKHLKSTWKTTSIFIDESQFLHHFRSFKLDKDTLLMLEKQIAENIKRIKKQEKGTLLAIREREDKQTHEHNLKTRGAFYLLADNDFQDALDSHSDKSSRTKFKSGNSSVGRIDVGKSLSESSSAGIKKKSLTPNSKSIASTTKKTISKKTSQLAPTIGISGKAKVVMLLLGLLLAVGVILTIANKLTRGLQDR